MAKPDHLNILREGVAAWNDWRAKNPAIKPDLSDIDLTKREGSGACWDEANSAANLATANLSVVKFQRAKLDSVIFRRADLSGADFTEAGMNYADCRGVIAVGTKFDLVEAVGAKFQGAKLDGAVLVDANWSNASFVRASLEGTPLRGNFSGADLRGCDHFLKEWKTGLSGVPDVPASYPTDTPVELIVGLNSHTRRMVTDGLYVKALWERSNKVNRLGLRIWGVTCGYGQSLARWILWSVTFILLASAVETQLQMNFANHHTLSANNESGIVVQAVSQVERPSFEKAVYHSVITFATLGYGDITPITAAGRIWVIIVVCAGYIMLGGLVSIFATKLGRLA